MAFGILQDKKTPRPPGTVPLDSHVVKPADTSDQSDTDEVPDVPADLDLKKKGDIILQPQPTDSPNDPLNWSYKRKITIFFIILVSGITVGGIGGMLSTGFRLLATQYHTDFPNVVAILSPPAIVAGAIGLFLCSAISAVWGKRIQFVIASVVILFATLAGFFANSLQYYAGIGTIGALFGAPFGLLGAPIISDMIYVHERGTLVALSSVVGVIGSDASHIIAGNIINRLGIKYTFIISFGVWIPILCLVYFFIWETTFDRKEYRAKQAARIKMTDTSSQSEKGVEVKTENGADIDRSSTLENEWTEPIPTMRQRLQIYRGRLTNRSFFKSILQPFPLLLYPSVIFATIVHGAFATWTSILGIINLQVISFPPYALPPDQLAYISIPGSIVGFVSSVISGLASDRLIRYLAKRNNGIYEPEFRLLLMIPAVIFSTIGFALLGPAYAEKASVVKLVGLSLLVHFASPFASAASFTYILDTQQRSSTEAFVATSLFRAVFGFITTQLVPTWFEQAGSIVVFNTLVVLNLVFSALTIPMYIFGKKLRGAVSRNEYLSKFAMAE